MMRYEYRSIIHLSDGTFKVDGTLSLEKYHFLVFLLVVLNSMIKLALTKTFLSRSFTVFSRCPQVVWYVYYRMAWAG